MKIVSFETQTVSDNGFDIIGDLTIFFEFTDETYNLLTSQTWYDLYDLFVWCQIESEDFWNVSLFEGDDSLGLSGYIYEHTTQKNISDIYQF